MKEEEIEKKRFLLLISVPAIVILAFVGTLLFTAMTGEEILLKTVPVDPRDLFRGDFVNLRYEISSIDLNETPHDHDFISGEVIYGSLSKKETFWTIDFVSHDKPQLVEDQVCMRGLATGTFKNNVIVQWGIESYFIPEGKGMEIERQMENISAIVAVDSSCRPLLRKLLINGQPLEL
jgi:uncharacterized membrane-anchored protein